MSQKTLNYLQSWATLTEDEVSIEVPQQAKTWWRLEGSFFDYIELYLYGGQLSKTGQSKLLSYLLHCIDDKGWRSHLCTNELGVSTCMIVVDGDHEFGSDYSDDELDQLTFNPAVEKESRAEVVLYAYVKALAAQRQVTEGSSWRHFKGDLIDVKCLATWPGKGKGLIELHGVWSIEEENDKFVTLCRQEDIWTYPSLKGSLTGDRIFYTHDGKAFARLKDDFLGVVGPKYPEMEGCLRFAEADNA